MGRRRESLYAVIMEGIRNQLNDEDLHRHVEAKVENLTNKRMVKALILGFYDHDLTDREIIHRVAVLAAKYRANEVAQSSPAADDDIPHRPAASAEQDNKPRTVVTELPPVCGTESVDEASEPAQADAPSETVAVTTPPRKARRAGAPRVARAKPGQAGTPS